MVCSLRHNFEGRGAKTSVQGITQQLKKLAQVVTAEGDTGMSKFTAQSISYDRSPGANIKFFSPWISSLDRHFAPQILPIRLAPDEKASEPSWQVLHKNQARTS